MQREIKFRAWDKFRRIMCNHEDINIWDRFMKDDMSNQYSPLMQYTGLHDKNGKEIYEGDILEEGEGYYFEVVWEDKWAKFKLQWRNKAYQYPEWNRGAKMQVIGNIHDNPELAEVSE